MKKMKFNLLPIIGMMFLLVAGGCMEEEILEEVETCSCSTVEKSEHGEIISSVRSAEESPITGNCYDLNFFVIDEETGHSTRKECY